MSTYYGNPHLCDVVVREVEDSEAGDTPEGVFPDGWDVGSGDVYLTQAMETLEDGSYR